MAEHRSLLLTEGEDYWFEDDYLVALDHGYFRYGISRSYTALTLGQYSGNTTITVEGDNESHVNACVKDERTGLIWSKAPSSAVGPSTNGLLYWDDHCVQIQHDGANGGWAQDEKVTQAVSGATGMVRQTYETGNRLTLYNVTGTFDTTNTISGDVAGGPDTPSSIRVGAKKDIWSYVRAANMAALAGHRDWRIPNLFELISIMLFNHTNGDAEPDNAYFTMPGDTSKHIWSSSHMNGPFVAGARFDTGGALLHAYTEKSNILGYVCLVRGPDLSVSRPCRLPATGQVVMSTGQFADDGLHRVGAERDFTVLDDGQYKYDNTWTANGDPGATVIANACVLDNNTGLMWSKETTTYTCAWKDIAGLRADVYEHLRYARTKKLGGHDDWRIPTVFELASIMDCSTFNAFSAYFSDVTRDFWTVTPQPNAPSANVFRKVNGSVWGYAQVRTTHLSYIRFVRGGSTDGDL